MSALTATIISGVTIAATAGTSLASGYMQSSANKKAAQLQKESSDKALTYEKERDVYARGTEANRYGTMMGQNAPYVGTGAAANTRMADLLGLALPQPGQQNPWAPQQSPQGQILTMRAPDGSTKQVPAHERDHWISKGAQQV